ncbi:hypothetical protein RhiirC2_801940, partial [Rhizophagus irregularis]
VSSLEARYQFSTPGLWTLWDSVGGRVWTCEIDLSFLVNLLVHGISMGSD